MTDNRHQRLELDLFLGMTGPFQAEHPTRAELASLRKPETCDDCEGKMELARLKYSDGISIAIESVDGVPALVTFASGEHAVSAYARDTLQLLDSANLNTTANELRERLECDRAIASSRLDAINRLHSEANDLRAKLEDASRQLSEVSAIAKATMGERETLKLKLAERDDAIREMAKARSKMQDAEASRDISSLILCETAYNRGGQFLQMYKEWSRVKNDLAAAHQTIAQLRQADTVRPAVDAAEVWPDDGGAARNAGVIPGNYR